jgi:hypothetical protein
MNLVKPMSFSNLIKSDTSCLLVKKIEPTANGSCVVEVDWTCKLLAVVAQDDQLNLAMHTFPHRHLQNR